MGDRQLYHPRRDALLGTLIGVAGRTAWRELSRQARNEAERRITDYFRQERRPTARQRAEQRRQTEERTRPMEVETAEHPIGGRSHYYKLSHGTKCDFIPRERCLAPIYILPQNYKFSITRNTQAAPTQATTASAVLIFNTKTDIMGLVARADTDMFVPATFNKKVKLRFESEHRELSFYNANGASTQDGNVPEEVTLWHLTPREPMQKGYNGKNASYDWTTAAGFINIFNDYVQHVAYTDTTTPTFDNAAITVWDCPLFKQLFHIKREAFTLQPWTAVEPTESAKRSTHWIVRNHKYEFDFTNLDMYQNNWDLFPGITQIIIVQGKNMAYDNRGPINIQGHLRRRCKFFWDRTDYDPDKDVDNYTLNMQPQEI